MIKTFPWNQLFIKNVDLTEKKINFSAKIVIAFYVTFPHSHSTLAYVRLWTQHLKYMVYLTKGAGKYKILSRVRVKLLPREAFKVKKYFPERPPGKSIKILSRVTH